jgi:hypothetical protein
MTEREETEKERKGSPDTEGKSPPKSFEEQNETQSQPDHPAEPTHESPKNKRERFRKWLQHWNVVFQLIVPSLFSLAVIIVIAIQALIYNKQLTQMKRATRAATKAAKASKESSDTAKKSIDFARESARLDQRAWVTTTTSQLAKPLVIGEKPLVTVSIINSGKTPALNVITGGDADISEELSDVNFNMPIIRIKSKFVLGPGVTGKTTCEGLNPVVDQTEIDDLKNGQRLRLYVRGVITYDDVFGRSHQTTFCAWINGKDLEGPTMHSCGFGNKSD